MTEQQCYIGENAIEHLSEIIAQYKPCSVVLVRGGASYAQSGAEKIIGQIFNRYACKPAEFRGFSVNPKMEEAKQGAVFMETNKADLIIAVGGGSALDVAKAMRLFYAFKKDDAGEFHQYRDTIPLIAIPTTAGTGSEATHFSVLYDEGKKYSIAHPSMLPDVAVVDPVFTLNINPYLTACTGADALSQAIEAYWNVHATEESDAYVTEAIPELFVCLPLLIADGSNAKLRERVSIAAFKAGKAINITKTTAPHAFSYAFTTYYGLPHGHAVALTIPYFMQFNYADCQEQLQPTTNIQEHRRKMQQLYTWLGIPDRDRATKTMKRFIEGLGLEFRLPANFNPGLIRENINAARLSNNPRIMKDADIENVLTDIGRFAEEDFSRYNGEGTNLRKAQLRLLDILIEVDKICRKHNIPYWLDFGSLLGAVRHKGFIPWDDDLDISVMRKDYKRLREVLQEELPDKFFFSDWTTDPYHFDNHARIKDTKSYFPYPLFSRQKVQGVHLDVFILDFVTSAKTRNFINFFQRRIWRTLHRFDDAASVPPFKKCFNKLVALVSYPIMVLVLFFYNLIAKSSKIKKVSYLRCLPGEYSHLEVFFEQNIFPCSVVQFESREFMAPANVHHYLELIYGDYMQIPPENKRLGHVMEIEIY